MFRKTIVELGFVAIAVLVCFALLQCGGCETENYKGKEAVAVLRTTLERDWSQNPFPPDSVVSVIAEARGFSEKDYWFRVEFRPEKAEEIMERFKGLVNKSANPVSRRLWEQPPNGTGPALRETSQPSFWHPRAFNEGAVVFQVVTVWTRAKGPPMRGAGTYVSLMPAEGVAYVHVWAL